MEKELRLFLCPHVLGEEGERPGDREIWSVRVQETRLMNFLVEGFLELPGKVALNGIRCPSANRYLLLSVLGPL